MLVREDLLRLDERLQVFLSNAPRDVKEELGEARAHLLEWVDLDLNWNLTDQKDEVERRVRGVFELFHRAVELLKEGPTETIVVPDTNAIAAVPDPRRYEKIAASPTFKFALLPTVLGELDRLKVESRSNSFRNRVVAVIRRIKGWRVQGSLIAGVTVDKTITVFAVAAEPDISFSLSWLDRYNADDRIIASVLELQRRHTASLVILVTGDINLQNKAEAAGIPWSDPPETPKPASS
jgi:rRNA-processing protein FCF1